MSRHIHDQNQHKQKIKSPLVIGGIVVLLIIMGALVLSSSSARNQEGAAGGSQLSAEERTYDFGRVSMAQGKVTKSFALKNPGDAPITIRKMYTSCMCTTAALVLGDRTIGPFGMPGHGIIPTIDELIQPGEEAEVQVTFDPAAHGPAGVGPIRRTIVLENVDGSKFEFEIKALVTP